MKIAGIYMFKNTANGKAYIGSSVDILHRKRSHNCMDGSSKRFHCALKHYGINGFDFSIIEEVNTDGLLKTQIRDLLIKKEQFYIDTLRPEYNLSPTAYSCLGLKHTREQKIAKSKRQLGHKTSEETKKKIGDAQRGIKNHRWGKTISDWQKKIISEANKGKKLSQKQIENLKIIQQKPVAQYDKNGNLLNVFVSALEAENKTGIKRHHICNCRNGTRKSSGGYIWKYPDGYANTKQKKARKAASER